MCVTSGRARLSKTIIYAGQAQHGEETVHVLGYQNRAETYAGPNAMVLPFPSREAMGPENVIDTTECKGLLKALAELGKPHLLGATKGFAASASRGVRVFHAGSYTVVMSQTARWIPRALEQVPENRRPTVQAALFEAYTQWYPQWPVALCCWDGSVDAEPLLWWYKPLDATKLFYPGLDSHTGDVPVLGRRVETDHTLVWPDREGAPTGVLRMPDAVRKYIAPSVTSRDGASRLLNGDWWLPTSGRLGDVAEALHQRRPPPGAA